MHSRAKKRTELPEQYTPGFLRELDGRTEISQRLNAAFDTIVEDAGGLANLAHTKVVLIERFVFLTAALQTWEREIAMNPTGSEHLLSRWIQGLNSLQGLGRMVGMDRAPGVGITLKAYVKERGA